MIPSRNDRLRVVALMPSWNAERFIVPVLESLAAQTYSNLHVLISDDASTDRTAEICAAFVTEHANFRLIRQPRNLGWVGNVNALLRAAEGEYFFFAFHDDVLRPGYVERLADALDCNPRAVVAFSDMVRRAADVAPTPEDTKFYLDLEGIGDRVERGIRVARLWGRPPSYIVTMAFRGMFREGAARAVGGLRRHIAGDFAADWPWLLGLALRGEFVRVPEPLVEKYYRPTTVSAGWKYSLWQRFGALTACMHETRRARLPAREELTVQYALLMWALRRHWWRIHE